MTTLSATGRTFEPSTSVQPRGYSQASLAEIRGRQIRGRLVKSGEQIRGKSGDAIPILKIRGRHTDFRKRNDPHAGKPVSSALPCLRAVVPPCLFPVSFRQTPSISTTRRQSRSPAPARCASPRRCCILTRMTMPSLRVLRVLRGELHAPRRRDNADRQPVPACPIKTPTVQVDSKAASQCARQSYKAATSAKPAQGCHWGASKQEKVGDLQRPMAKTRSRPTSSGPMSG